MGDVATAQSVSDAGAFAALRASHIGSLTPLLTPAMSGRHVNGAQLGIRYGLRDEDGQRTHGIAAAAIFGVGLAGSATLTAGFTQCAGCSSALVLGGGGDMRVFERGDLLGSGSSLAIGVSGELGYAQLKPNGDAIALGIGAPVTVTFGATTQGMRIAPFFTPTFGVGQVGACPVQVTRCGGNGQRWVMGGGIGFWNPLTSVSASLGVNQVMLSIARPVFGVNVVLGGR
jgi:hypothetical protein